MNRAETFDRYGVEPFGERTVWSVRSLPGAHRIECGHTNENHRQCVELASYCVTWKAETMSAPAFWYFCTAHSQRYLAWQNVVWPEMNARQGG